ncbi:LuxE/PaaK family acyltransferase [Sediminibacterium ginsengisoli]|uniref:Acyl-protein synthetase, LuxE n=1 Tax=Sediminibacterium ginsengisoli TaxID=413434 RepID=A0A1T4QHA8_9BACT|nr:acyl transferase [Sediminibacterium ginsengisoli]SKA03017.1 Acyl-protein synthetase, LuxE [Sediminibacterium ginsengisoli]
MLTLDVNNIFSVTPGTFDQVCLEVFRFQYDHNPVYRQWCDLMGASPATVKTPAALPSLPVSFFKTHRIATTDFDTEIFFESSGTTQTINSRHWIRDITVYRQSFIRAFEQFYGPVSDWCIIGLLPAYLERQHSSLVMMVDELVGLTGHPDSGFYLYEHDKLDKTLRHLEENKQQTLLIGVTFGLLDFAEAYPQQLKHTIVMETGGMKGRRREMTRAEVHGLLKKGLGVNEIHSEYGMTELLSQAYSKGEGRFVCPPWMRVLVRDEEDPKEVRTSGRGLLQIIDLANLYSVSFIATEDVGMVYPDGSFEVWGRLDNSDIRGCSLLVV